MHALMRHRIIYVFLKVCIDRHAASAHQITKNSREVNQKKDKASPSGVKISWKKPRRAAEIPNNKCEGPIHVTLKKQSFKAFTF